MRGRKGRPPGARNDPPGLLGPELVLPELPVRWCIGCGKTTVRGPAYCRKCRERLKRGTPVDVDEIPTLDDLRRVHEAERRRGGSPAGFNLYPSRTA